MSAIESTQQPELHTGFSLSPSEILDRYLDKRAERKKAPRKKLNIIGRITLAVMCAYIGVGCKIVPSSETEASTSESNNQKTLIIETKQGPLEVDSHPDNWDYFKKKYTTLQGDTWYGIADKYYGHIPNYNKKKVVQRMMAANPTEMNHPAGLRVGAELRIPVVEEYRMELDVDLIEEEPLHTLPRTENEPQATPTLSPAAQEQMQQDQPEHDWVDSN